MFGPRVLGAVGTLLLVLGCSGESSKPEDGSSQPPAPPPPAQAPPPPAQVPELPTTGERDADGNRIDDVWDRKLLAAAGADSKGESVRLEVILSSPLQQAQLDDFEGDGGKVEYVFRELSYGFIGSLSLDKLPGLARRLGQELHLVVAPSVVVPFMDEATRTGRVRGIWANGFAGSTSGYSGNSNITIAVLDTGVYEPHTDLNGRKQGWQDYTADGAVGPRDIAGHGTHVTAIALGSGAAFGSSTGTLKYTQSGNLASFPEDTFAASPVHTPAYFGTGAALSVSAQAEFSGAASGRLLTLSAADGTTAYSNFGSATGPSPLSLSDQDGSDIATLYDGAVVQTDPPMVTNFAIANSVANYPGVGDGFNALRGVAPTCKWFGAKVFLDNSSGTSVEIGEALDDLAARKVVDNIKIANLSLGVTGGGVDTSIRAKVNSAVNAGIVVVVAAGNDHPSTIGDPGRASKVITVGAASDKNELTEYTDIGALSPGGDEDNKPDVLAPGGSAYRSQILAADSGSADGNLSGFADLVANDYANMQGTSMATPFVSGSIALMIDALQQSGTSWSFGSSTHPLLLKMLLLASATETNLAREQSVGDNPTLGRAAAPKDRYEGYGIINPDAAIEAIAQTFVSPLNGSVSNVAPARLEWERRAWGRKLSLVNGATVLLNLSVPGTADYDLYLYAGTPEAKGNPVIRASSTGAALGADETINFVSSATETAYLFVKRVVGHGAFSLNGSAVSHCGDGALDTGELCDPAIAGAAVCCTATCTTVTDGTTCNDGNKCTTADSCQAGSCGGSAVVCAAQDSCHTAGSCDAGTGACSNPERVDGSSCDDGNECTQTDECESGACKGSSPVVCAASDQCHQVGICAAATGVCSNPIKTNNSPCNDSNLCTQTDTCQAGKCSGSNPVVCTASDQCHAVGTCAPGTGMCSNPAKTNGDSCDDGSKCTQSDTCEAGACKGQSPVVCLPTDQCHAAGTCAPATGVCSNPAKPNDSPCSDGSLCTQSDTCQAGSCTSGDAVTCAASDQCHDAGSCNPASGECSSPAKTDGAACNDDDLCTQVDTCQAGSCSGVSGDCVVSEPGGAGAGAGGDATDGGAAGGESGPSLDGGASGNDSGGVAGVAGQAQLAGSAGLEANGGAAAASAGAAAAAGSVGVVTEAGPHSSSGCGCSVPGEPERRGDVALLLAGAAALVLLRRRAA